MEAGGGKLAGEAESLKQGGLGAEDLCGGQGVVQLAQQGDEAADEGGLCVGAEMAEALCVAAGDPDAGLAAVDKVGVSLVLRRQGGEGAGAGNDEAEPLLGVRDDGVVVHKGGLAGGEGHAGTLAEK